MLGCKVSGPIRPNLGLVANRGLVAASDDGRSKQSNIFNKSLKDSLFCVQKPNRRFLPQIAIPIDQLMKPDLGLE